MTTLLILLVGYLSLSQISGLDNLTGYQLATIRKLRDFAGCGTNFFTLNLNLKNYWLPWFCVAKEKCFSHWNTNNNIPTGPEYGTQQYYPGPACTERELIGDADTCCFIGNLEVFENVTKLENIAFLTTHHYQEGIDDYTNRLFELAATDHDTEQYFFQTYVVCSIVPVNEEDGFTVYTPSFCILDTFCDRHAPGYVSPPQDYNFCGEVPPQKNRNWVCCPPSAIRLRGFNNTESIKWQYKTFPKYTTYAVGLRSSIQCEMYSKYVCLGINDMCPYRILYRDIDTAYPMEAYHQAMVGVKSYRTQIFHCQGTIVSRQFILSAAACTSYEGIKATIALVGDYRTDQHDEKFASELLTYIAEHHLPLPHSGVHEEHLLMVLFKLWRPMELTPFRRPACINYQIPFDVPEWLKPGSSLFTGYGVNQTGGRWNITVKRYILQELKPDMSSCFRAFYRKTPKTLLAERQEFCGVWLNSTYLEYYNLTEYLHGEYHAWGPCEFDLGAPMSRLLTVPYCQFLVKGVMTQPQNNCNNYLPYRFHAVAPQVKWLEQQIYADDFDLFDLDMSWPSCDRSNWQYINATYLDRSYLRYTKHKYSLGGINKRSIKEEL